MPRVSAWSIFLPSFVFVSKFGICNSMSTDQLCVVFGNVRESWTQWKKRVKKIIPANKKWREKMRPDFSKCDCSYVVWSVRAGKKLWSPLFWKLLYTTIPPSPWLTDIGLYMDWWQKWTKCKVLTLKINFIFIFILPASFTWWSKKIR
jgi:hypothetical protein